MRYSFISAAVLAFVSAVSAADPTADFNPMTVPSSAVDTVKAGSTYTIKWTSLAKYTGTVTLKLMEGASAGTLTIADKAVGTGIENSANEYAWSIPKDIEVKALYGIQISWDQDPTTFQWSFPFHITAAEVSSSSVTVAKSVSSSAASTKTVQITPNTAYTRTPSLTTSTLPEVTTSTIVSNVSTSVVVSVVTNNSMTAAGTGSPALPTSNSTLSTSASLRPSSSATGTSPPILSVTGAAVAKVAHGGLVVLGGAMLAFAL